MDILLIGAQGSGKGTQAARLTSDFGLRHVASGDLFRKAFEERTELGVKAKAYIDRGELVPDEMTVEMVLEQIHQFGSDTGMLLDGFPRTIAQAEALDHGLHAAGRQIALAIYLDVPRNELLHRLSGRYICRAQQHVYNMTTQQPQRPGICDIDGSELYQRADDQGDAVEKRLNIFFHETIQLLDYYGKQHKTATVNGHQEIEEVQAALLHVIRSVIPEEQLLPIPVWQLPQQCNGLPIFSNK